MSNDAQFDEAFENCSREPINIPGTIQDFGVLVATDPRFEIIQQASENLHDVLGVASEDALGQRVGLLFDDATCHAIRNSLGRDTIETQREIAASLPLAGRYYQVSVHRKGQHSLVELIPEASNPLRVMPLDQANAVLAAHLDINDQKPFWDDTVEMMRAFLGHDRVMFYRFLPDGAGEVISEAKHPDAKSFKGLRFPASDIPTIARQFYTKTPIRVICDVTGPDTKIAALPGQPPLDLTLAVLRGKNAVHQRYLSNMGVGSTLTVPLVVNNALWGLFSAHHKNRKLPDPQSLSVAELIGKMVSLKLQHALDSYHQRRVISCSSLTNQLVTLDENQQGMGALRKQVAAGIMELIPCDGVALFYQRQTYAIGDVPSDAASARLLSTLPPGDSDVAAMDDLPLRMLDVEWGKTAGVLVIPTPDKSTVRVAFFRNNVRSKITWAGAPEKQIRETVDGPRLDPRNSFGAYVEQKEGTCEEWTADDLAIAGAFKAALFTTLSTRQAMLSRQHMGLMVRELNHRVRNILALVQSLAVHSRENVKSVAAYSEALESRIQALANAHNLLTQKDMDGVSIRDLVELELRPFQGSDPLSFADQPELMLRPDVASVLALVLHELTSNSAKYGALSTPEGQLDVSWNMERGGIALSWRETGGPPVRPPERHGFGLSIIESALPFEFNGRANIIFPETGVEAELWLPEDLLFCPPLSNAEQPVHNVPAPLNILRRARNAALIVEDNFALAQSMRRLLLEEGFASVTAVSNIDEALCFLDRSACDFCLLDANLRGVLSTAVAENLHKRGIPFYLATGYGNDAAELIEMVGARVFEKPVNAAMLRKAIDELFRQE